MSNHSITIFLVNPNVRAMRVTYEGESDPPTSTEIAKRVLFKTLDHSLKVGDLVIIPTNTRLKFTAVKIVEADVRVDLDYAANVQWLAGRVDVAAYEEVVAREKVMLDAIHDAEAAAKRKELADKLLANVDRSKLGALQIAQMTDVSEVEVLPVEPPPAPRAD